MVYGFPWESRKRNFGPFCLQDGDIFWTQVASKPTQTGSAPNEFDETILWKALRGRVSQEFKFCIIERHALKKCVAAAKDMRIAPSIRIAVSSSVYT